MEECADGAGTCCAGWEFDDGIGIGLGIGFGDRRGIVGGTRAKSL